MVLGDQERVAFGEGLDIQEGVGFFGFGNLNMGGQQEGELLVERERGGCWRRGKTLKEGILPAMILQKMQLSSAWWDILEVVVKVRVVGVLVGAVLVVAGVGLR